MPSECVVILYQDSLFSEGIASSLHRGSKNLDIRVLNPRQADVLALISELQPSVVILDTSDETVGEAGSVPAILQAAPAARIIHLDPHWDRIQIVRGEERLAGDTAALIEIIASGHQAM